MTLPKDVRTADVWRGATRVGVLTRTAHGSVFEYDASFFAAHANLAGGIAVHLPYSRRRTETSGVNLHTYFAGLLPEGVRLRALIRRAKTSEDDLFSLLIAAGPDTVGDLSVVPSGEKVHYGHPRSDVRRLSEVSFADLFEQSLAAAGTEEPSVPGMQEKISASTIAFPLTAPTARKAYILKLNPPDKPRLVQNEHFFMGMAAACRLETARVSLVHDRTGAAGLLVERFDRTFKEERKLVARHLEDACQFLDRYPADKYRVSCSEIALGLLVCAAPIPETARLIRLIAFSYLVCNGDLHAKNVSILADGAGFRLSPAYDLMSTFPYGDQTMALKMEGRDDNLRRAHFIALGERHGVRRPATEKILDEMCQRAAPWRERLEEIGLDARRTAHLRKTMEKREKDLLG